MRIHNKVCCPGRTTRENAKTACMGAKVNNIVSQEQHVHHHLKNSGVQLVKVGKISGLMNSNARWNTFSREHFCPNVQKLQIKVNTLKKCTEKFDRKPKQKYMIYKKDVREILVQ